MTSQLVSLEVFVVGFSMGESGKPCSYDLSAGASRKLSSYDVYRGESGKLCSYDLSAGASRKLSSYDVLRMSPTCVVCCLTGESGKLCSYDLSAGESRKILVSLGKI